MAAVSELSLPSFDQYLPPGYLTGGYTPYKPPAAPEPEEDQFAKLTPAQQAMVRKQVELENKPRGALGEIGTGFMRGVFSGVPELAGKALQWANLPGKGLRDYAEMQDAQYAEDLNPGAHGALVQGIAQGASMIAPSTAALTSIPFLAAAGMSPAGAVTAASALGGVAFGASQAQETYEKAIKAGKTPDEARALGLETGTYEAAGEFLGGKFLGGAFTGARKALLGGKKLAVEEALALQRNPKFLPEFISTMGKTSAVETSTEMGQSFLEAAAEKRAGVDTEDPWKAASSAAIPALSMTLMLGPLAGLALHSQQNQNRKAMATIDNPEASVKETNAAAKQLAPTMEPLVGKEEYTLWRLDKMRGAQWFGEQTEQRTKDIQRAQQNQVNLEAGLEAEKLQKTQADAEMLREMDFEARARQTGVDRPGPLKGAMTLDEFKADQLEQRGRQGDLFSMEGSRVAKKSQQIFGRTIPNPTDYPTVEAYKKDAYGQYLAHYNSLSPEGRPTAQPATEEEFNAQYGNFLQTRFTAGKRGKAATISDEELQHNYMNYLRGYAKPQEAGAQGTEVGFKTAKGSSYMVGPNGETTRNKAARPEHPGDAGPQPTSTRTGYMTEQDSVRIQNLQNNAKHKSTVFFSPDGTKVGLLYTEGPNKNEFIKGSLVNLKGKPEVGLFPIEEWRDDQKATSHVGSQITEVSGGGKQGELDLENMPDERFKLSSQPYGTSFEKFSQDIAKDPAAKSMLRTTAARMGISEEEALRKLYDEISSDVLEEKNRGRPDTGDTATQDQAEALAQDKRRASVQQAGQGELDLLPMMNPLPGGGRIDPRTAEQQAKEEQLKADIEAASRATPGEPTPAATKRTAMSAAFKKAGITRDTLSTLEAQQQLLEEAQAGEAQRVAEEEAQREAGFAAAEGGVTPRVGESPIGPRLRGPQDATAAAAANAQADAAMAGKINGNTPVAAADLMRVLPDAIAAAGLPPLIKQNLTRFGKIFAGTTNAKLWANQLRALKSARDGMKSQHLRDAMSALIDHLEKRVPNLGPLSKEKQNATAAPVHKENHGSLFQDPLDSNEKGNGNGQGVAEAESNVQAAEEGVTTPPVNTATAVPGEEAHVTAARALIAAIDSGGMALYPGKVNKIAKAFGLDVSSRDPVEQTIQRIRDALGRVTPVTEAPADAAAATGLNEGLIDELLGGTTPAAEATVTPTPAAGDAQVKSAAAGTAGAGAGTSTPEGKQQEEQKLPKGASIAVDTDGRTIGWGEFSMYTQPDGTISYDAPNFKNRLTKQEMTRYKQRFTHLMDQRAVLDHYKRQDEGVDEEGIEKGALPDSELYAFEQYNFVPQWGNVDSLNLLWTLDVDAVMAKVAGKQHGALHETYEEMQKDGHRKFLPSALNRSKENAEAALEWLKQYNPELFVPDANGDTVIDKRIAHVKAALGVDHAALAQIRKENKRLYDKHRDAYLAEMKRKGIVFDTTGMSKEEAAAVHEKVRNDVIERMRSDPNTYIMHAELPNYQHSEILATEMGKGDVNGMLDRLIVDGPSEWVRTMATVLRRLRLNSRVHLMTNKGFGADGERVYGRYNHGDGGLYFYQGGANAHTAIHEVTHAATVGRILFAKAAMKKAASARNSEEQAAAASLEELQDLMQKIKSQHPPTDYAFKNEEEFVAEVLSNEKFRDWIDTKVVDELTLGQRFMNWMRRLFGMTVMQAENTLEHATRLGMAYISNSRFGANSALSFDHSVTGAFAQIDLTVSGLVKKYEKLGKGGLSSIRPRIREAKLSGSTTYHMTQMIERQQTLKPLADGANQYRNADATRQMIRTSKQQELSGIITPFDMSMGKLSNAQAAKINQRLEHLAGEQSVLNIDLRKSFDENQRAGTDLDADLRDHVNALHSEYMRLDPKVRKVLDDSVKAFRKNYIQQSTQMLLAVLRSQDKFQSLLGPIIAKLDILDPKLNTGTNPRGDYYFDAYSANLDTRLRDAFDELNQMTLGEDSYLSDQVKELEKFYTLSVSNPYHHLGRSGEHFVEATVNPGMQNWGAVQQALADSGKVIGTPNEGRIFMRFDNPAQRDEVMRKMEGVRQYLKPNTLRGGSLANTEELYNLVKGLPHVAQNLIKSVQDAFPKAEAAEFRAFIIKELLNLQSDTAPSKAMARRKGGGVAGYDADFRRNFSQRAIGMATMLSNSYTMPMFDEAIDTMRDVAGKTAGINAQAHDQQQEVISEFLKRFANGMKPVDTPIIDTMKSGGYHYFLAFSPAFVLGNLTQTYHLGLPYLGARHGFVASGKELGKSGVKALKLVKQAVEAGWKKGNEAGGTLGGIRGVLDLTLQLENSGLSNGEIDMIRALLASGQLDTTQSYELGRFAAGETHTRATTMKALSAFGHYSEIVNRLTMALSSYNLESRKAGINTAHPELNTEKQLTLTHNAIKSVIETQFDYSEANTASAFGRHGFAGKVTPLLTSFKKYSFMTIEMLRRLVHDSMSRIPEGATADEIKQIKESAVIARKQLAGVMATTSTLAGTLGLPFAPVFARAVDAMMGDDDDPSDIKMAIQRWLSETFGEGVGSAIAKGIPRAVLGFDTSTRLGLGDLLPGTAFFTDRRKMKDRLESGALDSLGPAVSAGQSILSGGGKMLDGMVMDGLVEMTPIALRGPIKAVKMAEDQGYTTSTGNKLPMEVTGWDYAVQAIGFTPSEKAKQSETNFAVQQRIGLMKQRATVLSNKFYRAQEKGEDTTEYLKDVIAFSVQNPQFKIDLVAGLKSRAKARAVAEISGTGVATLPRYLPILDEYQH